MEVDTKKGRTYEVDLGAEKFIAAEKNKKKILVEIKTFSESILYKFHEALGQFIDYRDLMTDSGIDRTLYIAIATDTFDKINDIDFLLRQVDRYSMRFIVVDVVTERIIKWID